MNEKRLERLYKEFFEDESRLNSYNATQKTFIYKSSGVKRNREEFKKLLENPKNFENFWKNFKSVIKKSDGSDWLGTFEEFKRKMMEQDPKCLLNSVSTGERITRGQEEGEYVWELTGGDTGYFYTDGSFIYLYANAKNVRGKWRCSGENGFIVETDDGESYSSAIGKWQKAGSSTTNTTSSTGNTTTPKVTYKQNDATLEDVLKGKKLVKRLDKGDIVKQIQEKLGKIYTEQLKGVVDSKFGKKTKAAVIIFQRKNGLVDDGIVGEFTAKALFGAQPDTTPTETVDEINVPYKLSGSFTTSKGAANALDKAHNLKGLETELDKILPSIYNKKINPKITNIDFDITDNGNSYVTSYSVTIDKSNDRKAWVGFTSRGSAGTDYIKRADGQITGSENSDGKSLEQKLKSIGAGEMEIIEVDEDDAIPYKQYFVQFTKPEKFPPHQVNESNLKKDIKKKLVERLNEKKLIEDIVEKRLDYLLSQLKETKNYKNINQYKRSKLFIDELNELKSCGLL